MNFTKELSQDIKGTKGYKEGDSHQGILDLGYDEWQKGEHKSWGYVDMLDFVEEKYGDLARWAVQIGRCNQQVENGGFMQYFDNGYASEGGGCMQHHAPEIPLHRWMLSKFKELPQDEIVEKVFNILKKFHVVVDETREYEDTFACECCRGAGYDYETDEECRECNGKGSVTDTVENPEYGCISNYNELDKLSSTYYEVSKEWMEYLNEFFKNVLTKEVCCERA